MAQATSTALILHTPRGGDRRGQLDKTARPSIKPNQFRRSAMRFEPLIMPRLLSEQSGRTRRLLYHLILGLGTTTADRSTAVDGQKNTSRRLEGRRTLGAVNSPRSKNRPSQPIPPCWSCAGYGLLPTRSANSRHFQWQSTSTKPISRSHPSWVSTSSSLFEGSSCSQEIARRNSA
jgi:hypothetical protein